MSSIPQNPLMIWDCAHVTDEDTDDQSMKEMRIPRGRLVEGTARLALSLVLTVLWQAPIWVSELFLRRN